MQTPREESLIDAELIVRFKIRNVLPDGQVLDMRQLEVAVMHQVRENGLLDLAEEPEIVTIRPLGVALPGGKGKPKLKLVVDNTKAVCAQA